MTSKQPKDFAKEAQEWIAGRGLEKLKKEEKDKLFKKRQEMLFYRVSEIHARAKLINEKIRPDLVVCLHLNASPWKDPEKKELGETNDFPPLSTVVTWEGIGLGRSTFRDVAPPAQRLALA